MIIGILANKKSYLPEIIAYKNYFTENNIKVIISDQELLLKSCDVIIVFCGFFLKKKFKNKFYIHDYSSLSTPPFCNVKDLIKKYFNYKPNLRIFNSKLIKNHMGYKDKVPCLIRSQGVLKTFFQKRPKKIKYDFLYTGSIETRKGLDKIFFKYLKLGFSILVVGNVSNTYKLKFSNFAKIKFLGPKKYIHIHKYYKMCNYGLNYIPDEFPYNAQYSTKFLEYSASKLNIISNKTVFMKNISKKYKIKNIYDEDIHTVQDLKNVQFQHINMLNYEWNVVIKKSGILKKLCVE
jgi:hypothetical protein|tara:strand:+ start:1278 stop:2153 length:876 start_codon:yes stop_codon:yes gene_type:complete